MRTRLAAALAAAAVGLAGCTAGEGPPPTRVAGISTSSPSPSSVSPSDPAVPSEPGTSRSPAPPSAVTADDHDAALAAARARRAFRPECDAGFADEAHEVVTATADGLLLVHVVCFVGAHQTNGELRVWDGRVLRPLRVEQWQFGDVLDHREVVGSVAVEGDAVVNLMQYRGIGDCGLVQRWSFDGTGLVLEEAREQECSEDGEPLPPGEWPVVHQR